MNRGDGVIQMRGREKHSTKRPASARPRKRNFSEAKPVRTASKAAPPITARADSPSETSPHKIATKPSREVGMTADWWTDLRSAFAGSDDSLYMVEIIEELGGVEQRRYLRIDGGTDLSRAEFEERETKAGLALNPPPGVEPLDRWRNKLKKDQEENNPDYRPGGLENVTTKDVGISEEEKKKYSADLVKWSKARREAEGVINRELVAELVERRKARRDKDCSIDSPTVGLQQVHFDKAVEIASKRGVSPELILIMRNAQQVVRRTSCIIPKVAEAEAAFCSRLAQRAHLEAKVTEASAENQQTEVDVRETTESGFPKTVAEWKRCDKKKRKAAIGAFIVKVTDAKRKITRKDISTVAGYKTTTDFERFQRRDRRRSKNAEDRFTRVLNMNPDDFIQSLEAKQKRK